MEGKSEQSPKTEPKSGLAKVASAIDRFLFEPNAKTDPTRPEVTTTSPDSKTTGLQELRDRLAGDVTRFRAFIEEGRVRDNEPRAGWRKLVHQIGSFIDGELQENIAKRQWKPEIERRLKVMEAINQGDEYVAKKYLADAIEEAIKMAKRGMSVTEDRLSERIWIAGAQRNIDLLRKIDPEQAEKLQKKLDGETGNPLSKFWS